MSRISAAFYLNKTLDAQLSYPKIKGPVCYLVLLLNPDDVGDDDDDGCVFLWCRSAGLSLL